MAGKSVEECLPSRTLDQVNENIDDFFMFMYERHKIYVNRFEKKLAKPWTENEILRDYKFTNVYRELDRHTKWLIDNVINKNTKDKKDTFWKIVVFRYFNRPELFESMGGVPSYKNFDAKKFQKSVEKFTALGEKAFTDAYIICPPWLEEDKPLGMVKFYCKHVAEFHTKLDKMFEELLLLRYAFEFRDLMTTLPCIGDFLSYEVYADLCYTKWFQFDENDFVNVGPGSELGLRLLYPSTKGKAELAKLMYHLANISSAWYETHKVKFPYLNGKELTVKCIEHSLCEYSKYWKMKMGIGKQRQKFTPHDYNSRKGIRYGK